MLNDRITFDKVLEDSKNDDVNKRDFIVNPRDSLRMDNEGNFILSAENFEGKYTATDWGQNQILEKLGIPIKYAKRLPKDLLAENVNYWLEQQERNWLLRTRTQGQEGTIRGVLSDRYTKFDNTQILEIIAELMQQQGVNAQINMWELNDGGFHLRVTFPQLERDAGNNDILRVGCHFENSEVGQKSVRITPMVYRLICTNGLMGWTEENTFQQRHIHLTEQEMFNRVSQAIGKAMRASDEMLEQFIQAKQQPIDNPAKVIEELGKKKHYSKKLQDEIKTRFYAENENNLYGLVNAFTSAAQILDTERRVELEKDAYELLTKKIAA